jgi:hypothetical protein
MAAKFTKITDYEVQYSSNLFPPRIWLKNGANFIGQLIFMPDGSTLPADGESGGQVNLYYHLEDFQNAFSLLSEEEVVYLLYAGTGPENENGLLTAAFPLGNVT